MASMPHTAGLLLAAGQARRFGRDKRQLRLPSGRSLMEHALLTLGEALGSVHAVILEGDDWAQSTCERCGARAVIVPRLMPRTQAPPELSDSLAAGLQALQSTQATAVVVGLADMPGVSAEVVDALVQAFGQHGGHAVPVHQGRLGHPRLLPRPLWHLLAPDTARDEGARHRVDWARATPVPWPDASVLQDIDTPDDWAQFLRANPEA